jgi:hypothetical protein
LRLSDLPQALGYCSDDIPRIAKAVNAAQLRLLHAREAGDEGWWGCWAEMVFEVDPANPYITTPRSVARLEAVAVCETPVPVNNQFYEYLQFGNGLMPKTWITCNNAFTQVYSRNTVPIFRDMIPEASTAVVGQNIMVFPTDQADLTKSVIIQGTDTAGNSIYSQDVFSRIQGEKVALNFPFVSPPSQFGSITGIQKDVTNGPVQIVQSGLATGDINLLLVMEATETVASYRRYYLNHLPRNCCHGSGDGTVQVKALVKLDFVPVMVDTDYCLIQNQEAIIEECMAIRYSRIDTVSAKQMARDHHRNAIGLLNGELNHFLGKEKPAMLFKPFGSADLRLKKVGTLV